MTIYVCSINTYMLSQQKFSTVWLPPIVEDIHARPIGKYKLSVNVISNDRMPLYEPHISWQLILAIAPFPPTDSRIRCTTHLTVGVNRQLLKMDGQMLNLTFVPLNWDKSDQKSVLKTTVHKCLDEAFGGRIQTSDNIHDWLLSHVYKAVNSMLLNIWSDWKHQHAMFSLEKPNVRGKHLLWCQLKQSFPLQEKERLLSSCAFCDITDSWAAITKTPGKNPAVLRAASCRHLSGLAGGILFWHNPLPLISHDSLPNWPQLNLHIRTTQQTA